MFCPEGYVSLAELWDQYRQKRLRDFYETASEHYASRDFHVAFVRGSPLDICEHVFLKSVSQIGVCLAAPDGQVMSVYSPLYDGSISLLSVLAVSASATASTMNELEPENAIDLGMYAGRFYRSWLGEAHEEALWRQTYPVLSSPNAKQWEKIESGLGFHGLPMCFERDRFVINNTLPPWTLCRQSIANVELLTQNFGGWAICMARENLNAWQPYLDGKGVYPDQVRFGSCARSMGRPDKQSDALQDYQNTFPEGHDCTLKAALRKIEMTTGNLYSESTIRRALKPATKE